MNGKDDHCVVIVPLADGANTATALPVARELARLERGTLRLLVISGPATQTDDWLERLGLEQDDIVGAIVDRAAGGIVPATLEAARRWPESMIVIAIDAISPAGGESGAAMGRELEELLTEAPGPLVLVPKLEVPREWRLRRLLVPHDGTPTTGAAVGPAVSLAATADAELVILHVASADAVPPAEPGTMAIPRYIDQPQHEWPAWAEEFRERLAASIPEEDVRISTILATGDPAQEIIERTTRLEADLVVLGWQGELAGGKAATLRAVIRSALAPLMILRST